MEPHFTTSPRWSPTTKLLVGLVIVGIVAFLFIRFTSLLTPLLMVFILAYILHPIATMISYWLRVSWRAAVNILYFVILILLISSLAVGGVGLVGQVQSLIQLVQTIVADLPAYVEALSGQVFQIGPFTLDMRTIDLNALSTQLLSFVQPLLGRTGNLVTTIAGGAAEIFGWTFFVLIVSYFLMVESSGLQSDLIRVEVPGYNEDLRKLGSKLNIIWNSFLRGQIFIFAMATVIYIVVLSIFGVRYAIGIAFLAGLAKFLPYIGPAITWVIMALVTFFQSPTPFGMQPLTYMLMVVITTTIIDWIIDNLVVPRIMAQTLRVHPAAVLVTALIAANLLGILGVVIAAPFLASVMLLGRYTMRKMLDLNPWPPGETIPAHPISFEWLSRTKSYLEARFQKAQVQRDIAKEKIYGKEGSDEQ
ncbi:MAG TPA: AI-2E family transporter [Anaerolineales bacterium]|jgi:predicted PurR-regulated permease PerM|nr:AI-2E family transporter [Anaerolineales bacterium]